MMNFGRKTGRFLRVFAGGLLFITGILIPGEMGMFVAGVGALIFLEIYSLIPNFVGNLVNKEFLFGLGFCWSLSS